MSYRLPARMTRRPELTVIAMASLLMLTEIAAAQSATAAPAAELAPVTVQSNQGSMRPGALREDIVRTESISERAIERSGATNINEAVDKNPGIAVQVECSICNVRNVLLNNLPGRFTTLLIDGIPIFSSVSSAYGLDSVSVYGLERIDIARGAGASLIAPEALSGTVNIITKRPTQDENRARLQFGSYGSQQADAYIARPFDGGAIAATFNYNKHDSVDTDGNGISEFTGFNRKLGGLSLFLDDVGGFKVRSRFDIVSEDRGGGALGTDYAAIKADRTGNPFDFSKGPNGSPDPSGWINPADGTLIPYNDGRGGFSEIIFTDRLQFVSSGERRIGDGTLRLAFGAAQHKQDSFYEGSYYDAKQMQYYGEVSYRQPVGEWLLTGGLSYRYEDLKSNGITTDGTAVAGIDDYSYRVPGLFLQAYSTFLDDALELNASLRYDDHNVFGSIVTPRLNLLYHHTPTLSSRFSAGTGFRAPTSFFEQDHGILDTIRIERLITQPEESTNFSYALNYADERLAVTGSYNFNRIKNFATLDTGGIDANGDPITIFASATENVTVQGVDFNLSYQFTPALVMSAGGERFWYTVPPGTIIFARPDYKLFLSADLDQGPFELTAKVVVNGPSDLNKFHNDGSGLQNRYNFDATPKRDKSPTFATLDLRGQYNLNRNFAFYAGVDNVFDYTQADQESFLWLDGDGAVDVTHIWGPNRGRYLYAGVRLAF